MLFVDEPYLHRHAELYPNRPWMIDINFPNQLNDFNKELEADSGLMDTPANGTGVGENIPALDFFVTKYTADTGVKMIWHEGNMFKRIRGNPNSSIEFGCDQGRESPMLLSTC